MKQGFIPSQRPIYTQVTKRKNYQFNMRVKK